MTKKLDCGDLASISPIERAVVFILAFTGECYSVSSLVLMLGRVFNGVTEGVVAGVLEQMLKRKFPINKVDEGYGKNRKCFLYSGELTRNCALQLVQYADAGKWWPLAEDLVKANVGRVSYMYNDEKRRYGRHMVAMLGFMRLFVLGSDENASAEVVDAFNRTRESVCRAAAARLAECMAEPPVFAPVVGRMFRDGLFKYWLNMAFLYGRDVRPVLRVIASEAAHGTQLGSELLNIHAALCVWTGWAEGLAACGRQCQNMVEGCRLVFAGDFVRADAIFRKLYEPGPRYYSQARDCDYDNVPVRLLYQTVCMAGKPGKTRPAKVMRGELPAKREYPISEAERVYYAMVDESSREWGEAWKVVWDGQASFIASAYELTMLRVNVPQLVLMAWSYHRLVAGRVRHAESAKAICARIPELHAQGYLNLAGLLLSLMVGAYTDEERRTELDAMQSSGLWFFPRQAPEPEWKSLLGVLHDEVSKVIKQSGSVSSARHLVWKVNFKESRAPVANLEVIGISPVLAETVNGRERRKRFYPEDLKPEDLGGATPNDRLLLKTLVANRDRYWGGLTITSEAVAQLCELINLEFDFNDETNAWKNMSPDFKPRSITFERQPCCLESTIREDGGVALEVPRWVSESDKTFVVRRIELGRYAYIPISDTVRKLEQVFGVYGQKGKVEFPKEAMESAQGVLAELEQVVPVTNPNMGKADKLPQVKGASDCRVRLDFAEGVLTVRAVVRPLEGNAALVVEPGQGLVEKLVTGAAGSYWLVRDLEAERTSFQVVRSALADAEDWFDGRANWQIEDMATAIESLMKLKALEPAVPLEWMDTRRLNVVNAPKRGVQLQSTRTADEWFSVKGSFTLDDGRVVNVLDLLASMSSREGRYVRLSDGDYVALTKSMAKELDALAAVGRKKGGALEVSRAALPMLDNVFDGSDDESLALPEAMAASAEEIRAALRRKPKIPSALQATLRPYQADGYVWLSRLAACGFGSCLADDMGLGKTLQVIALLLERIADGVSLVVAPSSVCGNWRNEIHRFAPTLNPILALECADEALATFKAGDVVIVSYGYLLFHEKAFEAVDWNGLVLDEAQAIKNDASKRAHVVKRLQARFRVAATGTPVENHLGELWSLFDFLNPGLLGPITAFASRFVQDGKAVPALKKIVKPLILRRLKGDVLDDLPEKTEVTIPVELGKAERSAYEGCRLHALAALADKESEADRFSILAELTRLRRFCCHPSLVLGSEAGVPSAKMEALVDLLESLHQGQHKALVFSQFTDYLAIVRQVVVAHGWSYQYLDGSTPTKERERLVNEFQTGESEFFLISLKAGGTGLNLTAANYVILLDPWWNPAVENQAADRAHRIGQKQPVTVYRLVASDTVEERVIELHQEKTALAADLLDGTAKSTFTPSDLIKLFQK